MPQSTEISVTYQVVTPCFSGGADGRAEFRLPSFKGVLRFWWRARAWSRYDGDTGVVRQEEERLFGGADAGQSRVALRLVGDPRPSVQPVGKVLSIDGQKPIGEGARYLGYGLMHPFSSKKTGAVAGALMRECLEAPFSVTIRLRCRGLDGGQLDSLIDALRTLGLLGGLGSRSRRGYGSLLLQSLQVDGDSRWRAPRALHELGTLIGALRPPGGQRGLPEYTALSSHSRHVLLASERTAPMALLDLVGAELVRFRSSGHDGKILGGRVDAERRFKEDHLLLLRGGPADSHPRRVAFGLPLNFGKPGHLRVRPADHDRRASPLFIRIHECDDRPVAIVSFLPARFLPGRTPRLSVGGTPVRQADEDALYRPVHEFLDRLLDQSQRKEPFTAAVEVAV